ncbi:MobC family plasmid mobilization relaxosome protein [Mesorhizobium sp. P16.1]|uniref:MobC family plasmid mobilization relaxosome protein n=1 Tax=unclassified Mesorhizobium TaxID=325217 RepID=UPI0021A71C27|nr:MULTISPECIES: MobC family plasmid mobilization relaxosome protein [unclassified Mesorhizobium]MCT2580919.1 MobC family plasmid mobilization relaxosome protein [Mesorhizobium sp. P13.3]MDF3169942.1 MobC family plasmid mobilization relaxosome protein [Mesorhizobium sp. P16.1]MDF3181438.1 MobC family plasmid mobilization relaxosome protein [Mesorhizobium sp. P17.1]MDF3186901.1 MobC family plasmid mobilization relaxosome protein [Mesorhizobium sp. ICCV3110.1]
MFKLFCCWQDSEICGTNPFSARPLCGLRSENMGENKSVPRKTANYGEVVRFRVSADEKTALAAVSERERVPESEVIRRLLRAETGLFLPVADVDRPAVEGLQEQLRKIGGNLNQAVRAMNAGRVGYEPALAKSLAALLGMIQPMNKRLAEIARPARARRSPDQ